MDRRAPGRREDDRAAPMQLEQQGSGGHVLEPSGAGAPIPGLSEFLGEPLAMPVWMGGDQPLDLEDILVGEGEPLDANLFRHEPSLAKCRQVSPVAGAGAGSCS